MLWSKFFEHTRQQSLRGAVAERSKARHLWENTNDPKFATPAQALGKKIHLQTLMLR